MQTKKQSFIEAFTNVIVGYVVAILSQIVVFPFFDIVVTFSENLLLGLYFTVVSLARSYGLRRFYNWRHNEES